MRNKAVIAAVAAVLILAAGGFYYFRQASPQGMPSSAAPQPEIVLGFVAALTNNAVAPYGIGAKLGFQAAVNDINASGGILGRKIKAIVMDDQGDKDLSRKDVQEMVTQDKAAAIIGPSNSGNMLNWMDITEDNEIISITPIATASELTTKYAQRPRNFVFRMSSTDKEQMRMLLAWGIKKTDNGKIAVLYDTTPYGIQGEKDVTDVLARWGKAPVFDKQFDKAAPEETFVSLLKDAQKAGADAIVIYSLVDGDASFVKASAKIPNFKPIFLATAAAAVKLWDLAGPPSTNMYFSTLFVDPADPRVAGLAAKTTALNGGAPTTSMSTSEFAYDAVYLLKAAFEKVGSTDKEKVFDAFENTSNVQGVTFLYTKPFSKDDHEGYSASDYRLGHWQDGKLTWLDDEVKGIEIR